ncbi:MAG: nitrogen regulation protein NR(II) [Anaerolineae bacterium]
MLADIMDPQSHTSRSHDSEGPQQLELLTSGIVHDFNNLLTSIMGQSSLALRQLPADSAARVYIEKAMKAAEYASLLTHQLLVHARGDFLRVETIDLNELVRDNVSLLNCAFLKGIDLELNLAPQLPEVVARRGHLQQVVMNLVINAAEAIQVRKGKVVIRTGKQRFVTEHDHLASDSKQPLLGEYVFLRVADTGTGMDEATLNSIFSPHFSTKQHGRGLGLTAVREIVDSYHGGITVESKLGRGTTFTAFFPSDQNEFQPRRPVH